MKTQNIKLWYEFRTEDFEYSTWVVWNTFMVKLLRFWQFFLTGLIVTGLKTDVELEMT